MNQVLANLIPDDNVADMRLFGDVGNGGGNIMADVVYSPSSNFIGTFIDDDESPSWARISARYLDDEFLHDTPGRIKYFGDVLPQLENDGAGECWPVFAAGFAAWERANQPCPPPYARDQDRGSCVAMSAAEHMAALLGWRIIHGGFDEVYKFDPSCLWYAGRGYCSDGWNGGGCASIALRTGAVFRTIYGSGSNSVDLRDEDGDEQVAARTWCRTGIKSWLSDISSKAHPFEDGAITRWQGGMKELRALFAAGGVIHTSGRRTSGGSKPFTIGSVGPHMQSGVGCDDSDDFRRFCQDVIGVQPRDDDFPVVMNQTWSTELGQWRGECAPQYWPEWWGRQPAGAWVWWASDVLSRLSCDYAWLPRVKGFLSDSPLPPTPTPNLTGEMYAEQVGDIIAIRGVTSLDEHRWIAIPKPGVPGVYVWRPYPDT